MSQILWAEGILDIEGTVFQDARSISLTNNTEADRINSNSRVDQSYTGTLSIQPVLTFTTCEIGKALTVLTADLAGCLTQAMTGWNAKKDCGSRSDQADHENFSASDGLITINELTWSENQKWEATLQIDFYSSDGATNPITYAQGALPAHAVVADIFKGGRVDYTPDGGALTALLGWVGTTLSFNNTITKRVADGFDYPTSAALSKREITYELTTTNMELRNSITSGGIKLTNFRQYLRKAKAIESGREVDTDLVHIDLHSNNAMLNVQSHETAGEGEDGSLMLRTIPVEDDTNDAVIPSVGVAIPAIP